MTTPGIIFIYIVSANTLLSTAEQITLHENANFKGESTTLTLAGDECITLPDNWRDRASSVDTKNNCIIAWSYIDCCCGGSERIAPGTPHHPNLEEIDFNDRIRSVQLCSSRPSQVTGGRWVGVGAHESRRRSHQASSLDGDNEQLHQAAQRHAEYLAKNNKLETSSKSQNVAEVEASREEEAVRKVIKSWMREERHYDYKYPGFREETRHFTALVWKATSEVGIGVAWNPDKKVFLVVAKYNPAGNIDGEYKENVLPQQRFAEFPIPFYEHHNFEGEELKMEMIGGCHNFPEGWHDRATSVKAKYRCIVAWEHYGCTGKSVKIKDDVQNLGEIGFNDVMSSFNLCSTIDNS